MKFNSLLLLRQRKKSILLSRLHQGKNHFVVKVTSGENLVCCQGYIREEIILLSRLHQGKYSVSMFKVISVEKIRMVSRLHQGGN